MADETTGGKTVAVETPPIGGRAARVLAIVQFLAVVALSVIVAIRGGTPPPMAAPVADVPKGRTVLVSSDELRGAGVLAVGVTVPSAEPGPVPERQSREEVLAAVGRVRFGAGACTAQAVYPRRPDGKWDVLTAAHCVSGVGQQGRFRLRDGREIGVVVITVDKGADCCWCRTTDPIEKLPAVLLADGDAEKGSAIWQSGYGWNEPGVVKEGETDRGRMPDGKQAFTISLSQGDSGGGFFRVSDNRLVSVACCTTQIAAKALAFGPSVTAIRANRLTAAHSDDWEPAAVPECDIRGQVVGDGHRVVGIPQRMPGTQR